MRDEEKGTFLYAAADVLHELREADGRSQKRFTDDYGLHAPQISRLETHAMRAGPRNMEEIIEAYADMAGKDPSEVRQMINERVRQNREELAAKRARKRSAGAAKKGRGRSLGQQ